MEAYCRYIGGESMTEKPIEYTRGKWETFSLGDTSVIHCNNITIADTSSLPCHEANAQLICAAVNMCISINKENPMAVADKTQLAFETLEWVYNTFDGHDDLYLPAGLVSQIQEVLSAKIQGGK